MNLLTPFGALYGLIMTARNRMYDRGFLRSHSLGARTISIGNLTTGGTGKTPLVALTASILAENGEKVCILTRGYGRENENERVLVSDGESVLADAAKGGDEPVELARKLIGKAVIISDADRLSAGRWAKERFGITTFVLDDGFQHRRVRRDLDIVCVDATDPCGNGRLLPAGRLRESFAELRRADITVVTRANLVDSTDDLVNRLRKRNPAAAIFTSAMRIRDITRLEDFAAGLATSDDDERRRYAAHPLVFTGLGNPENFRRQLEQDNFDAAGFRTFPDHHRYTRSDIESLEKEAGILGAPSLMTTAKDAVKLTGLRMNLPVFVAEAHLAINDHERFRRSITEGLETGD